MTLHHRRALLKASLLVSSLLAAFALALLLLPPAGWGVITPYWKPIAAIGAGVHAVSALIALHRAGDLHGIVMVAVQLLAVGGLLYSTFNGLQGLPGSSWLDLAALNVAGWALAVTSWRMVLADRRARPAAHSPVS